jgi:hypothetical protein
MNNTNTGGPAFPLPSHTRKWDEAKNEYVQDEGMTLRDYFAAKAMQALIIANGRAPQGGWPTYAENTAYKVADAMLKARKS